MVISKERAEGGYFSESRITNFLVQLCIGLNCIHNNWVLHKDLKPQSIFLSEKSWLKIVIMVYQRYFIENDLHQQEQEHLIIYLLNFSNISVILISLIFGLLVAFFMN